MRASSRTSLDNDFTFSSGSSNSSASNIHPVAQYLEEFQKKAGHILNLLREESTLNINKKLQYYTGSGSGNEEQIIDQPSFFLELAKSLKIDIEDFEKLEGKESERLCLKLEKESSRIEKWATYLKKKLGKPFSILDDGQKTRNYLSMSESQEILHRGQENKELSSKIQKLEEQLQSQKQVTMELQREKESNEKEIDLMKRELKEYESKRAETLNFEQKEKTLKEHLEKETQRAREFEEGYRLVLARNLQLERMVSNLRVSLDREQQISKRLIQRQSFETEKTNINSIGPIDQILAKHCVDKHFMKKIQEMTRNHLSGLNLTSEIQQKRVLGQEIKNLLNPMTEIKNLKIQLKLQRSFSMMSTLRTQVDSHFSDFEKAMKEELTTYNVRRVDAYFSEYNGQMKYQEMCDIAAAERIKNNSKWYKKITWNGFTSGVNIALHWAISGLSIYTGCRQLRPS